MWKSMNNVCQCYWAWPLQIIKFSPHWSKPFTNHRVVREKWFQINNGLNYWMSNFRFEKIRSNGSSLLLCCFCTCNINWRKLNIGLRLYLKGNRLKWDCFEKWCKWYFNCNNQTDRQKDRHTDRQTDRQTDRHTHTHTHRQYAIKNITPPRFLGDVTKIRKGLDLDKVHGTSEKKTL